MRNAMISAATGLVVNAVVGVAVASAQGTGGASLVGQTKASPAAPRWSCTSRGRETSSAVSYLIAMVVA